MAYSKQLLVALLLGVMAGRASAVEGDVLAASDFRSGTQGWELKGLGSATGWSSDGLQSEGDVIAAIDSPSDTGKNWYYSAPKSFLGGDKSLAYNGWLVFDFGHFEYESMGMPGMDGYDVYLVAKNKKFTLGLRGVFKVDDTKLSNTYSIRLEEDFEPPGTTAAWELVNVVKAVDGKLVTKMPTQHEFITCLQTLTGVWIRGSYFRGSEASWLKDVKIIQGAVNKGGNPLGAESTLVNGALVYGDKNAPPTASTSCCSSRTCVSNDKYEITFDRPGCMQSSDMYCCMSGDSCTRYARTYDQSKAAEIVRGTDFNEGRAFFTPGSVDKCTEVGEGQYGAVFSSCQTGASVTAGVKRPASWSTGTKNQNMGLQGIPIPKPFVKDYYMGSIPRICSSATLTVEAHGDLADAKDNIMVYGEDDVYLGTIFAGNLTYLKEGHRAYDAYGAHTQCSGDLHDPAIAGSGDKARLADPHHPLGYIPQHKGYRGGPNVSPGVQGSEDTRCTNWQAGGKQPLSLQHSESAPYVDSIAISQDRMMQYSADGQIKFTFRSVRDDSAANSFSGTGGGGATRFCNFDTAANPALEGCDLDGKVMFRSIKLKFSAGVCFTKAAATDYSFEYLPQIHTPQNLNISISYSVPSGDVGQPGGDAAFSVTAGADIFGTDRKLVVYDKDLNKVGELFARESFQSLRSHVTDDKMVMTSSFGATDAPKPFHATTNCDTTSPILGSDVCTPADNQWGMKDTLINYTDTLRIPRENIAKMAVNGKVQLYVTADVPANAFSLSSAGKARFSPITLAYPLMHCFMKAIKTGPNFGIFLDRPMSYYFTETGFPMPAGDVTVFVAASWQQHVRYVTRHVGAAVSNKFAYDGVEDGLPVMRVDKDTVADMGSVWVYKNSDGQECCPSTHKPTAATGMHQVSGYSNCMGTSACTDPHLSTVDACTETNPCPTAEVDTGSAVGTLKGKTANLNGPDGTYVGLKIILYAPLKGGAASTTAITKASAANTYGATAGNKVFPLKISCPAATPDCGGGAVCTYKDVDGTFASAVITCSAVGAYTTVPVVRFPDYESPEWFAGCAAIGADCDVTTNPTFFTYDATLGTKICKDAACTGYAAPVFTAVLEDAGNEDDAVGATPGTTNVRTIVGYVASDFTFTVKTNWLAAPTAKNLYRISADGITAWARNGRDGGSATGAVAVPLDTASISCSTRPLHSGVIEANVDDKPSGTTTGMVRLDASSSTFDTAYNDFKIKIRKKDAGWHTTTVSAYSGTIAGHIKEDQDVTTLAGAVTFKLNAATAKKVVTAAPAAAGTPTASADGTAIDVAYMLNNGAGNDWFNGAKIEVDIDGDASTSDDIYVRTIKDYAETNNVVTVATPFVRKSVVSGKTALKLDGTQANANKKELFIYDGTDAASKQWSSSEVATTNDAYNGMYLLIDLDGYPGTIDDIELQLIDDYDGSSGKLTLAAALSAVPQIYSTWTIIEKLADLDYATTGSTFRIYAREAVLAAKITGLPAAAFDSKTIGAAASAGATQVTLDATYAADVDDYAFYKLRISENGVTDEYSIRQYKADKTASIQPPAVRAYSAAATTVVLPTFEIYQDLGTSCLENTNMTVVYSYGTAREVSNDPGELSTIYSNWDAALARSSVVEQRDVRAWTLKLNGEGYYSDLYPGEGLGGYDKNALRASGAQTNTLKTTAQVQATAKQIELVDSTAGLQVGGYLKLAKKDGTQQEIVKVTGIVDGTKITVDRGALGSNAEIWAQNAVVFVYQAGFNRGQGMDEMAELGGVSRYSSPANDAYTGLLVSIVAGTGAGQTRWISDYHGDSRTVYVGGSPWGVVPDATSKYKIYYSSEVVEYHSVAKLAVATYPRPVKQGYLVEFAWYECARDVPASFLNNAWTDSLSADGVLDENYGANQAVSGLPECKGSLGMRKPKQGPAHVYPRAKVLQTDYVAGLLTASTSTTHITLDSQAATEPGAYVGRKIQVLQGKAHCYVDTAVTADLSATGVGTAGNDAGVFGDQDTLILKDAAALTTLTNGGLVAGSFIKVNAQEYMQVVGIAVGTFTLTVNRMVTPPGGCLTQTASTPAVNNAVLLVIPAPVRGVATITASFLGASAVEVYLDQAIANTATDDAYTIFPAPGVSGRTTVGEVGQNGEQYYVEEIDVVRQEYPELIEQHREWPHGYSYLQMKAGHDGQHVGNLFLKDYTQYSTESYYTDSITIPKSVFETYVRGQPNGVSGEFPFTIKTPPGSGNIELLSIVIGYPVVKEEDASSYDSTDIETKRTASHGPPPFYPYSEGWSGADAKTRTARTHPRFQTHAYTSTCGNGVHDAGEYCDDGNQADGDGCSSSCALEAGWVCETVTLQQPSICTKGAPGARVPDMAIGCKAYACEIVKKAQDDYGPEITATNVADWNTHFLADANNPTGKGGRAIICSGTPTDGTIKGWYPSPGVAAGATTKTATAVNPYGPHFPICKLNSVQGTCTKCVSWDSSDSVPVADDLTGTSGGILGSSGVAGYDGSSKRRLLADDASEDGEHAVEDGETVTL